MRQAERKESSRPAELPPTAWHRLAARWSRAAAFTRLASRLSRQNVAAMDFGCYPYPCRQTAASAVKLEHDLGRHLRFPQGQGAQADRIGADVEVTLDIGGAGDAAAHDQ
jgi:hypothetical protein